MWEKVYVLSGLKRHESLQAAHSCGYENELCSCMWVELALGNFSAHLTYEELVDWLHFEGCTIQATILPLKFRRCGIVFGVIFTTGRQSIHI